MCLLGGDVWIVEVSRTVFEKQVFTNRFFLIFLFLKFFKKFIYFWLRWVFVAARGLSLVAASGGSLRCNARASRCGGFSLRSTGSRRAAFSSCGSWALECRLISCGAWA